MKISEVMNTDLQILSPESNLIEAAQKMRDGDFGVIPVCDGERLQGMITDRDITVRAVAEQMDVLKTKVRDVMTAKVLTCFEDDDVTDIAQFMADHQVRRLPVLNRESRLVGIVSIGDLSVMSQDEAGEATSGISEKRHDEPTQNAQH